MLTPLSRVFPAFAAFATAAAVHAQTVLYVDQVAPPGGDGRLWSTAFRDLQDALAAVSPTDFYAEVRVAQGIYTPDRGTFNRDMAFAIGSAVSLYGGYAGLLSANPDDRDPSRFVSVLSGDLRRNDGPNFQNYGDNSRQILSISNVIFGYVDGFTISGANADLPGYFLGAPAVIGVRSECSTCYPRIVLRNSRVVANLITANRLTLIGAESLVIENTLVAGNRMRPQSPSLGLITCGSATVRNARIMSNDVGNSPVIQLGVVWGSPRPQWISNTLIASNRGTPIVCASNDYVTISSCTLADNVDAANATILIPASVRARVSMFNCILFGNRNAASGLDHTNIRVLEPSAFVDVYSGTNLLERGVQDVWSPGDPFAYIPPSYQGNPRFRAPAGPDNNPLTWQDNDFRLLSDSPCIDVASPSPLPEAGDLNGLPPFDVRILGNSGPDPARFRDLGAFELTLCPGDFNGSGQVTTGDVFDFVLAWFAQGRSADWNYDGLTTPQDLFDFLTIYFQGCP